MKLPVLLTSCLLLFSNSSAAPRVLKLLVVLTLLKVAASSVDLDVNVNIGPDDSNKVCIGGTGRECEPEDCDIDDDCPAGKRCCEVAIGYGGKCRSGTEPCPCRDKPGCKPGEICCWNVRPGPSRPGGCQKSKKDCVCLGAKDQRPCKPDEICCTDAFHPPRLGGCQKNKKDCGKEGCTEDVDCRKGEHCCFFLDSCRPKEIPCPRNPEDRLNIPCDSEADCRGSNKPYCCNHFCAFTCTNDLS